MIFIIAFFVFLSWFQQKKNEQKLSQTASSDTVIAEGITIEPTPENDPSEDNPKPNKIDLQPIVDNWANTTGGTKSVLIYDLDRAETVGQYNTEQNLNTASLYKLFVVYEGYRRVQNGVWNREDRANYLGETIIECLDLAIRESNSTCAEPLDSNIFA